MQVQVAESGPCRRTLTIQVPATAVREHLDSMYASANQQVRMKGFRPGKVPRRILEKQFGSDILEQAKERLVNHFLGEACQKNELRPVGRIVVDGFEQLQVRLDAALEFTASVDVRPAFALQEVKGLPVDAYATAATDADIDGALQEIANQKRSIQSVAEPAREGDFVKVDLRFVDEAGNPVHERKGVQLNTRIPIAGTDPQAFSQALVGAAAGRSLELGLTFPDNFEKDAFRGQPGRAILDVHEVLRVVPAPIDEALAKSLDFAGLDALRADLRQRIGTEKVRAGKQRQEEQCLQQLLERHDFELPESLVEEQRQSSLSAFAQRLEQNGVAKEEIEKKVAESQDEALEDARRRVRLFFLIEAVARDHKLFVTENDVEAEIRAIAAANNATPAQVRDHLEKQRQFGELRLALLERKVRNFLRDQAKVVDRK
jgi:trigger factor